jgi:hypothetical protein
MTVLQFKPRNGYNPAPVAAKRPLDPTLFVRAWLCVAIGLYISPFIRWLEILSERDVSDEGQGNR